MTPGEEFRTYMKAANPDHGHQDGPHLSESTMIAYYRGELSGVERETVQAHLVACGECIALSRSVSDFFEPARPEEEEVSQEETKEQWKSFLQLVRSEPHERVQAPAIHAEFTGRRRSLWGSRVSLALAAGLVISLAASGWLAWRYSEERRRSDEVAAQLQRQQRELEQRLAQLSESGAEQINREREQRQAAEAERDKLQALLAVARPANEETTVFRFVLGSVRGPGQGLKLKLNTAAEVRLLIGKPGAYPQYDVDIADEAGRVVQKFRSLRPHGIDSALSFKLKRGSLSTGKYRLRLYGRQASATTQLGNYELLVNK